jgi:hypothetical protein
MFPEYNYAWTEFVEDLEADVKDAEWKDPVKTQWLV